eukprot:scaffold162114_cov44-Attheya_sp.AAC.2
MSSYCLWLMVESVESSSVSSLWWHPVSRLPASDDQSSRTRREEKARYNCTVAYVTIIDISGFSGFREFRSSIRDRAQQELRAPTKEKNMGHFQTFSNFWRILISF